ncbi:unnamed protein product [Miscanthus lutarioriparius]|uniref:Uncharacterized protein n=1 Tax=Miscanthus lutarioriparius TaxID=422564 RepID=A0A811MSF4_9POAL|nr:unnamed protein product [Miscanthus lutarioriparius]
MPQSRGSTAWGVAASVPALVYIPSPKPPPTPPAAAANTPLFLPAGERSTNEMALSHGVGGSDESVHSTFASRYVRVSLPRHVCRCRAAAWPAFLRRSLGSITRCSFLRRNNRR